MAKQTKKKNKIKITVLIYFILQTINGCTEKNPTDVIISNNVSNYIIIEFDAANASQKLNSRTVKVKVDAQMAELIKALSRNTLNNSAISVCDFYLLYTFSFGLTIRLP